LPLPSVTNSAGSGQILDRAIELYEDEEYEQAFPLYKMLANFGNLEAATILAWMYEKGNGVSISLKKAECWYLIASNGGEDAASYYLGNLYISLKKYIDAYKVLSIAAENGYIPAIYKIGVLQYGGYGTETDRDRAFRSFKYASRRGHVFAYSKEVWMLIRGHEGFLGRLRGILMFPNMIFKIFIVHLKTPESDLIRD